VMLREERLLLRPGMELTAQVKITVRNPENDVTRSWVLRSPEGNILIGASAETRPETIDTDLWPGLELAVAGPALCRFPGGMEAVRVHLRTPRSPDCLVDYHASRCCRLWETEHEVLVDYAFRNLGAATPGTGTQPPLKVNYMIRQPGLVAPVPADAPCQGGEECSFP